MSDGNFFWIIDYGRPSDTYIDDNSNIPFDFWFQLSPCDVYIAVNAHRFTGRGYWFNFSISESHIFDLTPAEFAALKEIFEKYRNILMLYFHVCIGHEVPDFPYTKRDLSLLLEFDLNETEYSRAEYYLKQYTKIYLIKDKRTGLTKIGRSNNPIHRLRTLIKQDTLLPYPNEFELVFAWEDLATKETNLHEFFQHKRVRGEWFELSDSDIESIVTSHTNKTGEQNA